MMRQFFVLWIVCWLFLGCGDTQSDAVDEKAKQERLFTFQGTPSIVKVSGDAISIANGWKEFSQLERGFDVMFQSTSNEDLILAIDDLLEQEKGLREGEYPEKFDSMKIKSRQKVFRTFLLKIKAGLGNNRDVTKGLNEMLIAYNALRSQMNTIANNQLNTELILNESL